MILCASIKHCRHCVIGLTFDGLGINDRVEPAIGCYFQHILGAVRDGRPGKGGLDRNATGTIGRAGQGGGGVRGRVQNLETDGSGVRSGRRNPDDVNVIITRCCRAG